MSRLVIIASLVLTAVVLATGAVLEVAMAFFAITFDLSGPNSGGAATWVLNGLSVVTLFLVSLLFCRWLVRRAQNTMPNSRVFE